MDSRRLKKAIAMIQSNDVHIESISPLSTPEEIKNMFPANAVIMKKVVNSRKQICAVLDGTTRKHILITGPCSIHNEDAALEYAERLLRLREKVKDVIFPVMRVYFEKPRTTVGWKGLIYDPDLNDSSNIEKGLRMARRLLLRIVSLGLPTATEILEPIIPQYIADLITWAAIGARTTESQTHRQLTSGLSMPIGFKNATDGGIQVALNAIQAAAFHHAFIGITEQGKVGIFRTKGNPYGHIVLRGGETQTNYSSEYIAFTKVVMQKAGLRPNIIVDCSHANSRKQPQRQLDVMRDVLGQIEQGETAVIGTMLESNLLPGSQPLDAKPVQPGVSVTDACIGWDDTEKIILEAAERLRRINFQTVETHKS